MYDFYNLKVKSTPLVIAHRGYCSLLPENTMEATQLALDHGDFSELDIMLTCDREPIVFHDNFLSRVTDVASLPEFAHKRREGKDDGKTINDWWVADFSLQEIQKLKTRQGQLADKRTQLFDLKYTVPTVRQFLIYLLQHKQTRSTRNSGLMIQIKKQEEFEPKVMVDNFARILNELRLGSRLQCQDAKLPIIIASFDQAIVEEMSKQTDLPLIQLLDDGQKFCLSAISKICQGIGISQKTLKDSDFKIIEQSHNLNLAVLYWTIRVDSPEIPFSLKHHDDVHMKLIKEGIDGLITEFPETTATIIRMMKYF